MSRRERNAKREARIQKKREARKNKKLTSKLRVPSGLGIFFSGFDYTVVIMIFILSIFGMAMVFSAGYYTTVTENAGAMYYLKRQAFFFLTGLGFLFFFANYDYHRFARYSNILMVVSLALLCAVLLVGQTVNGATRWIGIGSFRFTPSELSKIFMIIFTAGYLSSDTEAIKKKENIIMLFAVMIAHVGLIMMQPNLSTAIVIAFIMFAIMFVAGLNTKYILGLGAAGGLLLAWIMIFKRDGHWYARLTNWIDPFADAQGDGYQVSQSIIALGNGGLKGLGFGKSISKNLYLPEPTNDFILAIIGEELGFIGFIVLMILYFVLLFRLIMIALKAKDKLGFYLATGVAVMLGLQVIINVAVVTASMPATGITLPFISYGGTSIWSFMIAMGIALNVSRKRETRRITS